MTDLNEAVLKAFELIKNADADLIEIILLSFQVNGLAVLISCIIGLSLGAFLAVYRFRGRSFCLIFINALMGLPAGGGWFAGLYVFIKCRAAWGVGAVIHTNGHGDRTDHFDYPDYCRS